MCACVCVDICGIATDTRSAPSSAVGKGIAAAIVAASAATGSCEPRGGEGELHTKSHLSHALCTLLFVVEKGPLSNKQCLYMHKYTHTHTHILP